MVVQGCPRADKWTSIQLEGWREVVVEDMDEGEDERKMRGCSRRRSGFKLVLWLGAIFVADVHHPLPSMLV